MIMLKLIRIKRLIVRKNNINMRNNIGKRRWLRLKHKGMKMM